jgi:hypothetical protein
VYDGTNLLAAAAAWYSRYKQKILPGETSMPRFLVALLGLLILSGAATAADQIKLGIITELSGALAPPGTATR